ncbi:PH domain-containing protein [Lysinibacillus sp. NPDC096418]|uniref:PH domain-containing protein n=1 Tax=Lysinibacillus sp. NPDC096418 TaxID=3364138 RepID=UPI0037F2D3A0
MFIIVFIINFNSDSTFINVLRFVLIAIVTLSFLGRLKELLFTKVLFAGDGVRVYTGLFSKSERFVPKEKFENVQTATTVLQRLFGAHTVTMETGDATGDVTLKFVRQAERDKMEAYVLSASNLSIIASTDENAGVLFRPTVQDLLKASLTSFSFLAFIPIVLNVWSDLKLEKFVDIEAVKLPLWLTLVLILLAIMVAIGIGILRTFNSYYQYEISMDNERIYVQKGWLSKQSFSIRKEKVQAVIYKQSLYQRLLRVTTIRLISTGEIMTSGEQQINEFFPYLPTAKAEELMATLLPKFTRESMTHSASKKARKLIWLRPPIFAIVVAILGLWQWIFYIIGAVLFILTYANRILAYKNLAFTLQEHHVQVQSGTFTVETLVTKRSKLIELVFERSLLQRATGVMNMKLSNRAQPIHVTELKDIDAELQKELTIWFEQRIKDVRIDPKTRDGELKNEGIVRFLTVLKKRAQQL